MATKSAVKTTQKSRSAKLQYNRANPKPWMLVTGAGGFIGHHLVAYLKAEGFRVRGVDVKKPEYAKSEADEFLILDLRRRANCEIAARGMHWVYHLAADMGGIGYITGSHADISYNNSLMNLYMLEASRRSGIQRFLFSSSACVYPQGLQVLPEVTPLREQDAWPAQPEEGYGLEKLYMEKLCQYFMEDHKLATRVVRFHNVYGPLGTYDGGREKAPAAVCRKVASVQSGDKIIIWGDGKQTRSFMYVSDCVDGIHRLMLSSHSAPLNLGTDELVSIDDLAELAIAISGKKLEIVHDISKPQGVRGRNSDNTLLRQVLQWEPLTKLCDGLTPTYHWIAEQVAAEKSRAARIAAE